MIINDPNAQHITALVNLARGDAESLENERPHALDAFDVDSDGHDGGPSPAQRAIEALGVSRAAEIYCSEWDRIKLRPLPALSEAEAKERWATTISANNARDLDRGSDHDWEDLAYGFFLALGFNPYAARRLAGEVA